MLRELATLLAVGIPLLDALDTIAKQQGRRWRQVLQLLRDRVASGSSLAEAMGEQPQVFDDLCINIVAVGADAGTLEMALERLAQFKDRSLQFRNRVTTALLYPLIVLAAGLGVTVFLMTFVVPTLLETLTESGRTLPLSTRIVKAGSDLLIHYWWLILLVLVACLLLTTTLLNTSGGRTAWHRWQLRLPVIGQLARKQAIARVAIVMSTLMRSGITFDRSAEIAARLTRNVILRRALEQCRAAVGAGRDIAGALEDTEAFSPTVVQIFSVGQHSGHLEDMLERLATEYDRDVEMLAQRLTATLEPVLILLLAVVVGTIAFATILPILESGHVL